MTNQAGLQLPGALVMTSLEDALTAAQNQALLDGVDEVMVIGGEKIYRQCLKMADRLYLTLVEAAPEGDAWFPPVDANAWSLVEAREVPAGDGYPAHAYQVLDRVPD